MTPTTITVQYDRKFSDGDYGSEGVSMSMTVPLEPADANDHVAIDEKFQILHHDLRQLTLEALARSSAERVARAASRELNPPARRPPAPQTSGASQLPDLEEVPF